MTPGVGTLEITPDPVDFGSNTKVNKTSKAKKVTIKNNSQVDVMVDGETTLLPFAVKTQCKKTLKPGKSCKVSVTFKPTNTTLQMGELIVNDNAMGDPQMIDLTGTGK